MVSTDNNNRDSTNIRIKLKTKAKLEAQALRYGETHDDIISRLLKQDNIDKNLKEADYEGSI